MKITSVEISVFELPDATRIFDLVLLPGMGREQYTHRSKHDTPGEQQVMHVHTDEGIEGVCTVIYGTSGPITEATLEQLRTLVVGEDPLDREKLYHKLHTGTRWVYQQPGWEGAFDNCLWDIVGKAAGLPVSALMGESGSGYPFT